MSYLSVDYLKSLSEKPPTSPTYCRRFLPNTLISLEFKRKFGSAIQPLPELCQTHVKIELSQADNSRISENMVNLYRKGLSLNDIAKQTGKAKTSVRESLLRNGIQLRPKNSLPFSEALSSLCKGKIRPYYGFCYFQGNVTPDPREFENLQLIHRLWSLGTNPNRIADILNEKRIAARNTFVWNRNSVVNIIKRFENKQIVLTKEGKYELG